VSAKSLACTTAIRVSDATMSALKRIASREDRSITYVTRRALDLYVASEQGRETARKCVKGGAK